MSSIILTNPSQKKNSIGPLGCPIKSRTKPNVFICLFELQFPVYIFQYEWIE